MSALELWQFYFVKKDIFDIGEFFDIREIFCQKGEFKELDRTRKSLFFD